MTSSSSSKVFVGKLHRVQRGRRKTFVSEAPQEPVARPARVAVQLALAHQIRKAIDSGEVADQAAVARQSERALREVAMELSWEKQRSLSFASLPVQ